MNCLKAKGRFMISCVGVLVPEIGDEITMTLCSPNKISSYAIHDYNYRFYRDGQQSKIQSYEINIVL